MTRAFILLVGLALAAGSVLASGDPDSVARQEFSYEDGGRRDPFWPLVTESGSIVSYDDELALSDLMLQGIVSGADGNVAVINGRIVREGDMLGVFQVEKIMTSSIILDNGQEKAEVHLGKED